MGLGAKKMGSSSGSALARGDDMGSFEDTAKQAADAEAAAKRQVHNTHSPHRVVDLVDTTMAHGPPVDSPKGGTSILSDALGALPPPCLPIRPSLT